MKKTFIISNPLFGWKNNNSDSFDMMVDYFENELIPILDKNSNLEDTFLILGDLFNGENITFKILNKVYFLLEEISNKLKIEIKESSQTKFLKNIPNIKFHNKTSYSNYMIDSLYQLKKDFVKFGFIVIDESNNHIFYENEYSPRYNKILINDISELEDLDKEWVDKNHVELELTELAITNKLKLDIILSKFNFNKIIYPKDISEPIIIDDESFDVEDLVKKHISLSDNKNNLEEEFNKIIQIHKNKNGNKN